MSEKSPPKAPFVAKVVADATTPPRVRLLTGYVGSSCEKGCARLYADPELTRYLEIPESAIRHSEPVEGDSLGAVHLWVDRDAEIVTRGEDVAERRGRFLDGALVRAPVDIDPGPLRVPASFVDGCPTLRFDCQAVTRNAVCNLETLVNCGPSRLACPTELPGCMIVPTDLGCPRPSIDSPCDFSTRIPVACGVRSFDPRDCVRPTINFGCRSQVDGCVSERQLCPSENPLGCGEVPTLAGAGCDRSLVDGCRSTPGGCFDGLGPIGGGLGGGFAGGGVDPGRFGLRPRFRGF